MIVAGEASGDLHAAKLVNALREAVGDRQISFFGAGSDLMRAAGVETVVNADDMSVVGLPEIGLALPMFLRAFSRLKATAMERRPDIVVLVDFPDFNLKLARSLSKKGFKVVYYISPQLWAWRKYRIRTIRKYVDLVISILPFEREWYARHGVSHVEYVGSPLAREVHATQDRDEFCRIHDLSRDAPIVTLLPGSRHKEVIRILPAMLESAVEMSQKNREIQFIIAAASERNLTDIDAAIDGVRASGAVLPRTLITVSGETFNALNASDAAAVASGTATLETGIIGTPMAIVYKTSSLNYRLLRPLIEVDHFGLINLIAGERVATELIQDEFTPQSLASELMTLLEPGANRDMRERLRSVSDTLGHGGASMRAAKAILELIEPS